MLSFALKRTSVTRLRLSQAVHARAIHSDRDIIVEALKEGLDLKTQFDTDAQRLKQRQHLLRAMKVCRLDCATDRALFRGLVQRYNQILQEGELEKRIRSSVDDLTPQENALLKE